MEKGIKSHQKKIQEYYDYINNVAKRKEHVPKWDELTKQYQDNLLHHWKNDIERHKNYMEIKKGILYERRGF